MSGLQGVDIPEKRMRRHARAAMNACRGKPQDLPNLRDLDESQDAILGRDQTLQIPRYEGEKLVHDVYKPSPGMCVLAGKTATEQAPNGRTWEYGFRRFTSQSVLKGSNFCSRPLVRARAFADKQLRSQMHQWGGLHSWLVWLIPQDARQSSIPYTTLRGHNHYMRPV